MSERTSRWRLTAEFGSEVFPSAWQATAVEDNDLDRITRERDALLKWQRTGEHPVRNVILEEVSFSLYGPAYMPRGNP